MTGLVVNIGDQAESTAVLFEFRSIEPGRLMMWIIHDLIFRRRYLSILVQYSFPVGILYFVVAKWPYIIPVVVVLVNDDDESSLGASEVLGICICLLIDFWTLLFLLTISLLIFGEHRLITKSAVDPAEAAFQPC